jgi:flagellar motor switch protein FliG
MKKLIQTLSLNISVILLSAVFSGSAEAKVNAVEITQKTAETQIRHLLEPLLDKYCHDECKLMGVTVTVDLANQEEVAPGFDELEVTGKSNDLAPSSGRVKILMNDKVGPVSRTKLLELVQQYLDTLEYPMRIDTQIAHFPQPQGTEGKISQLRERVSKQFKEVLEDLLRQFCPQQCLLADFNLQTEVVNGEEAQYGSSGEFIQDGDTAIKIKDISATLLMDETLSPEEQSNIIEMAKLKTNSFKNVSLTGRSLKFPRPTSFSQKNAHGVGIGNSSDPLNASDSTKNLNSTQDSKSNTSANSDSKTNLESKTNSESKNNSETVNKSNNSNNSTNNNAESNTRQEKFERFEKIERVENGDAVQAELQKFKVFGLIFACSVLALLIFIAVAGFRQSSGGTSIHRVIQELTSDPASEAPVAASSSESSASTKDTSNFALSKRYEIERLLEELSSIYAQQPRVAKQVFSRVLTEEGVEVTAECIHLFGEGIVIDMLRDPSLQTDVTELMEYYAKNPLELDDEHKLELLRKLHSRTIAGKLIVLGNRSSNLFDFLAEMDGLQILELIRTESLTVKSIILTQCDPQKRAAIYAQLDPEIRMKLLAELSRIDYLPRDYIFNVATALKRKRRENPRLNTEALPGSEVLVSLLERTGQEMQKTVVKSLETTSPDSARTVKSKLVSIDTLRFLRDGQLLEVVLSLKHDELIQFLKGTTEEIRKTIFVKSPKELVVELEEELGQVGALSRETYQAVERKILNRMKVMANDGHINLIETNERMFSDQAISERGFLKAVPGSGGDADPTKQGSIKKVSGW